MTIDQEFRVFTQTGVGTDEATLAKAVYNHLANFGQTDAKVQVVEFRYGVYRKDDDGHSYIVPEKFADEFDLDLDKINSTDFASDDWYRLVDAFDKTYSDYRVDDSRNMKVILE